MDYATIVNPDRLSGLGADICNRLKQLYFSSTEWSVCANKIVALFYFLREKAQPFYQKENKDQFEYLKYLKNISDEDIQALLSTVTPEEIQTFYTNQKIIL